MTRKATVRAGNVYYVDFSTKKQRKPFISRQEVTTEIKLSEEQVEAAANAANRGQAESWYTLKEPTEDEVEEAIATAKQMMEQSDPRLIDHMFRLLSYDYMRDLKKRHGL